MAEIIPKEAPKTPKWMNILLYTGFGFLVVSIIGYFLLNSSAKNNEEQLASINAAIAEIKTLERDTLEEEVYKYQQQIDDFSTLSEQHLETSGLFEVIEEDCHPKTWFSSFNLTSRDDEIKLAGETESFKTLGEQMLVLKADARLANVELEKVSISKEGKIVFTMTLSLTSSTANE